MLAYADDLLLLAWQPADLLAQFHTVSTYLAAFTLSLNAAKSEYFVYNPSTTPSPLLLDGHSLPALPSIRYLGLYLSSTTGWIPPPRTDTLRLLHHGYR